MPRYRPMPLRELAERLGHTSAWVSEHYAELVAAGMPKCITPVGHKKWDRRRIEPWLQGRAQQQPASVNDNTDPVMPAPDELEAARARIAARYGVAR